MKLQAKLIKNAIMLPVKGAEAGPLLPGATGGVFNKRGEPIKNGFLRREYRRSTRINNELKIAPVHYAKPEFMVVPRAFSSTTDRLEGRYLFAGYLFSHYGHCLLESMSRLWCVRQMSDLPLVWLGVHNQSEFNQTNLQLFGLLGINNCGRLIDKQVMVEELIVPEPGYVIHTRFADEQARALGVVSAMELDPGKKVWLSRSRINKGMLINEKEIEDALQASGWIIYHPEEHTINQQVSMLSDAGRIGGLDGSAFHTLILMPHYRGRIDVFQRRDFINMDIIMISKKLRHNLFFHTHHYTDMENMTPGRPDWTANRTLRNPDLILNTLG